MALTVLFTQLETDLDVLAPLFQQFASAKAQLLGPADFSVAEECLLEGLLSRVWQSWNLFCRSCLIESCMGTVDASGTAIPGLQAAQSEDHVSGAAIRARRNKQVCWGATNDVLRAEPTWGDVDILATILPIMAPANTTQLLAAFSSGSRSIKTLQVLRNAAAHHHFQNLAEVFILRTTYQAFPIDRSMQALFWLEPNSQDYLIIDAIENLKQTASIAIS
jgi:hypothetical protein